MKPILQQKRDGIARKCLKFDSLVKILLFYLLALMGGKFVAKDRLGSRLLFEGYACESDDFFCDGFSMEILADACRMCKRTLGCFLFL